MSGRTATLYLGLGSNIEPRRHLALGVAELRRRFAQVRTSTVYRNPPVGFDGDDFLNLVARAETGLSPAAVIDELEAIHELAGRVRRDGYASRELDIDLLLYDRLVLPPGAGIEIPRRDVLGCDFVLRPLAEIAPDYVHPVTGRKLRDHWREFSPRRRRMQREALAL